MNRPNQPLPRPSEMVLAPPPRGIITPNTAGVGATPNLNTEAAMAPALGMAKVGAGVSDAGSAVSQLAEKYAEAKSISQQAEAQRHMESAESLITQETAAEPDETKWAAIADKHITKAKEAISSIPMSVRTAELVRPAVDRWGMHRVDGVVIEAQKTGIKKAVGDLNYKIQNAKLTGNGAALEQNLAARRQLGASTDGQDENDRIEFQQEQQKKAEDERMNATIGIARTQGAEAAKQFVSSHGGDEQEKDRQLAKIRQIEYQGTEEDSNELTNAVSIGALDPSNPGGITTPKQVMEWQKDNPRITPRMRELAANHVAARNDATRKANVLAHAPELASRYHTEALNFDFNRDGIEAYWALRLKIDELPAPISGEVSGVLEKKFPGRVAPPGMPEEIKDQVERTLTEEFNSGAFGSWANGTGLNAKGEPVENPGQSPDEVYKRNPEQYAKALALKAKVGGDFRKWARDNPKDAQDPLKVLNKINDLKGPAGRIRAFDDYKKQGAVAPGAPPILEEPISTAATGPKIDPGGIMNDLPDNPAGTPENTLFPNILLPNEPPR